MTITGDSDIETTAPLFSVTSHAFGQLGRIPDVYTLRGGNVRPAISVSGCPAEAVELALICHDPDAPLPLGFTHDVVYGIPAVDGPIAFDGPGVREATNSTGQTGWSGPEPPVGHGLHHYYFWAYALRSQVDGCPSRESFLRDCSADIISQARLVGTYER